MDDYFDSRWICEPFRLLDCCLVSNGGICVIVTSAERARDLSKPPVYILGAGQGHPGGDPVDRLASGAGLAKEVAFKMAGIELKDIDLVELYDCYTFTVLVTLEDYGFCPKGEGGPFVADGHIGPGGSLPGQHRRRRVERLLSVGDDAAFRSSHSNAGRGRRAPGEKARHLPGFRQRRPSDHAFDPHPRRAAGPHGEAQNGSQSGRGVTLCGDSRAPHF